ncbi:protein suppressor of sable [Scaptodrosophila lebanonensis]|uniref:Protein suppressor of sable n=1 Tax=Drosophila lebanonensis TaxID=7225 RepID=A0A6J2TTG7_DROLE|nr:protein suppressor of sable [Scaptodrosophila lebanonensis]
MSSVVATNSESAVTTLIDLDEDLEDGEIDDDDDDEPQLVGSSKSKTERDKHDDDDVQFVAMDTADKHNPDDDIIFMGMVNSGGGGGAAATPPENSNNSSSSKSKKPRPLEDDHAVSIEIAIANALKKKGIEPPMPKMLNTSCESDATATTSAAASVDGPTSDSSKALQQQQQQSRSSRRRKRKKEREREQKKDKEHKKRPRQDSLEEAPGSEDMDEYEMMNVRGGSPPPGGAAGGVPPSSLPRFPGDWADMAEGGISYETAQDYSSYDSYSDDDTVGPGSNANQPRRQRRDKESRGRKRRDRDRDNDRRHDGKRNRRDSGGNTAIEEKREPRKLELCKFYLMDCCAKRDKCSYMHKEFPCKYYYLGMECHAGDDCLFHHGEPLTEQLRNILLKHMETAPKEILGDFKRISRDQAMVQMTRRHEALCEEYKVENTWNNILANANNRRQEQVNQQQNQQQQQQQQQLMSQPPPQVAQTAATLAPIPSLLDMVINPPPNLADKADKKRKSRWAEKSTANKSSTTAAALASATASAPTTAATGTSATSSAPAAGSTCESSDTKLPAHLDLKNLTNVLSADHMSKLNKLGISNLEEMMQVPFGKLTEVGLTLVEIGEIQRKAAAVADTSADQQAAKQNDNPDTGSNQKKPETDVNNASSSNSNSNSNGFIMVDYTQYLKDAHVNFDRNDPLEDDCDDEEQLVIDDGNESEDERKKKSSALQLQDEDDTPLPSVFDLPSFMSNMLKDNKADPPTTIANNSSESIALPTSSTTTLTSATSPSETKANADNSGATIFSKIIFGDKHPDPEARAAFYRDIIRNPFKTHIGDADNDNSNSGGEFYAQHDSRSLTPTPTGSSSTPEPGSQSPKPLEEVLAGKIAATAAEAAAVIAAGGGGATPAKPSLYTRTTMYDFDPVRVEQQAARAAARKADKDLRPQMCVGTDRDIDMRLPFEPMKHYLPATEIDAAIFSHSPIRWQLQEVDVELASYAELRLAAAYKEERDIRDPRIRRVLGLPDHPDGLAHEERERKTSACISSPESVQMSPSGRDAQPTSPPPPSVHLPSMSVPPPIMNIPPPNLLLGTETSATSVRTDPRRDPRRAHLANSNNNYAGAAGGAAASAGSGGGNRQIGEIRNVLQASNWYKNLGSNNKIMVNQQLALVFTELKKFHQLEQPNKIFDVSFIVNNRTLQQIFGQLHIYIDDNGLVVQLLDDGPPTSGSAGPANTPAAVPNMPVMLPNMSQPPPNLANLIRQPPPNLCGPMGPTTLLQMGLPPFNQPPPNARPRLLGMPRNVGNMMMAGLGSGANNPFKPFGGGGGPGPGPGMGPVNIGNLGVPFNGIGVGPMRNFGGGGGMNNQGGGNRHFGGGGGVANRNQRGGGGGNRSRNNI